jgi:hypothetical protein
VSGSIHLGYVVGTGEPVEIPLRHTAVTGQTQESGKTTTLEGLISRSGLQAVAYVTKRGESSFHVMNPIPPYFQERADWKFVQSLLEASTETKLKFEQSWIMRASEGARTLKDVRENINKFLHGVRDTRPVKLRKGAEAKERWLQKPARGLSGDIYYILDKYLDDVMPQLDDMPYSTRLELARGLNVMDLRDYEFPLQALVVRSVIDWIRTHGENIITVIPEAWKFAPKQKGSPVRQSAEELVREGGALKNFLWVDSQDLAGVADVLMRQIGVWIFGVQRAKHEIERALDHMPEGLPARRPRPADIATLSKGQFYVCFGREMHKVYVQPAWMTAAHAEAIARGEEEVDSAREILKEYDHEAQKNKKTAPKPIRETIQQTDSTAIRKHSGDGDGGKYHGFVSSNRQTVTHAEAACEALGCAESEDEEAMWKEKYQALTLDFKKLQTEFERLRDTSSSNGNEDPGILRVSAQRPILKTTIEKPEVEVRVTRRVIEMDGSSIPGTIAILLSEGFFDVPKGGVVVVKELRRRGMSFKDGTVYSRLGEIAGMGFLTKEGKEFKAVPGMKINIVES